MATTAAAPQRRTLKPPSTPAGVHMSNVWIGPKGERVEGPDEVPINSRTLQPCGVPWFCQRPDCGNGEWVLDKSGEDPAAKPKKPYCADHGLELYPQPIDAADPRAVAGAKRTLGQKISAAVRRRKENAVEYAAQRLLDAQRALGEAGRRTAADYTAHAPSLVVATLTLSAAAVTAQVGDPLIVAASASAFAVAGAVIAYAAAYLYGRERARQRRQRNELVAGDPLGPARADARTVATATAAAGFWTAGAAGLHAAGFGQGTVLGTLMLGVACWLTWLVGRGHWARLDEQLAERRRQAKAEATAAVQEAVQQVQEAEAVLNPPPPEPVFDENDPLQVGARMAKRWADIAALPDAALRFAVMPRTRILPQLTRAVMAPEADGGQRRIGWEFMIQGDPGVLVPAPGLASPVITARVWLAAMLDRDPMSVALVERPDNDINRAVMLLTDGAPLGEPVPYLGRAGIQVLSNGTILGHDGRDIKGNDTYMPLYIPGQTFGGAVLGRSGGGKSQARRVRILNNLYAGIFTTMYDPKNFVDYSEFAGVIPLGCTTEHRDLILHNLWAEMVRRQQMLAQLVGTDRHGRTRPIEGAWRIERDGPPIMSMWDEFHLESRDKDYVARITTLARLQRATASGVEVATQGGGLADMGDSVLRMLLNQTGMEIYRMSKSQARLGGYEGDFDPQDLPSVAGMVLKVFGEGGQPIPQRSAFVTRDDVDGSVYDHLYAPDGTQILFAPVLPDATLELFEREGLMDLWRMGMGEGGLARLQNDGGTTFVPTPEAAGISRPGNTVKVKEIPAREMILAILAKHKITTLAEIVNHPMWLQDPGRTGYPAQSTVTRAAREMMTEGLLSDPNTPGVWKGLTPRGQAAAAKALQAYELAVGPARPAGDLPPVDPDGPAETERQALQDSEEKSLIRQSVDAAMAD
jgi:hypothetical protein